MASIDLDDVEIHDDLELYFDLDDLLGGLSDLERRVVKMRLGLSPFTSPMTPGEVADAIEVTEAEAEEIHAEATAKIAPWSPLPEIGLYGYPTGSSAGW